MTSQHYLVIRPISNDPDKTEPYIDSLSRLTGFDKQTIKQKFTGAALQVLKVDQNPTLLEEIAAKLKREGISSTLVSKLDIIKTTRPARVASLEIGQKKINLVDSNREVIASLDGTQKCLLVLSTMNIQGLRKKKMAKLMMARSRALPPNEVLHYIFHEHPIMDIYMTNSTTPFRIDSLRFNYSCLGDENKKSVALNFPAIIKCMKRFSSEMIIDTGFGEENLPFLGPLDDLEGERLLREFSLYSKFVFLSYKRNIFNSDQAKVSLEDTNIFKDIGGLFWAGPLFHQNILPNSKQSGVNPFAASAKSPSTPFSYPTKQPMSPDSMIMARLGRGPFAYLKANKRYLRSLGPPFLVYPLTIAIVMCFYLSYALESFLFIPISLFLMGVLSFMHSFVLLGRKHSIQNCPTSKIRSMPMGFVEVKGYARQKSYLRAPYSQTECVYYSYKVYELAHVGSSKQYRLTEWGESGKIPFYLEDETGKVLVFPENAIIKAGKSQDMSRSILDMFSEPGMSDPDRRVVERVIPVGHFLYVMGYAHPFRTSGEQRRQTHLQMLQELKRDPLRMKKYDLDGDGTISEEEWNRARKEIEEKALLEKTEREEVRVAISEHPTGGLFYIADKHEEVLVSSLAWRGPFFLITGILFIALSLAFLADVFLF
jgi:hypothetical protein